MTTPLTRNQRRAAKLRAENTAAQLASRCYDFKDGGVVAVTDRHAKAALRRAFTTMLQDIAAGPVAIMVTPAEANGFPRSRHEHPHAGSTWLAVCLDPDGRVAYALQSASSHNGSDELASDAARTVAISRARLRAASSGFPVGMTKGRA